MNFTDNFSVLSKISMCLWYWIPYKLHKSFLMVDSLQVFQHFTTGKKGMIATFDTMGRRQSSVFAKWLIGDMLCGVVDESESPCHCLWKRSTVTPLHQSFFTATLLGVWRASSYIFGQGGAGCFPLDNDETVVYHLLPSHLQELIPALHAKGHTLNTLYFHLNNLRWQIRECFLALRHWIATTIYIDSSEFEGSLFLNEIPSYDPWCGNFANPSCEGSNNPPFLW